MKLEVVKRILKEQLQDIYCDTCGTSGCYCKDCHKKDMYWSISDHYAGFIANAIVNECK